MHTRIPTSLLALVLASSLPARADSVWDKETPAMARPVEMVVHRSPTCGCCGRWLDHVRKHGFVVKDVLENDMDAKKRELGLPGEMASCHTAVVDGFLVEGHVPAGDIKKMLQQRPAIAGLAVPGMPAGTPGMEMGGSREPFAVMSFDKTGKSAVFTEYLSY